MNYGYVISFRVLMVNHGGFPLRQARMPQACTASPTVGWVPS